MDEQRIEVSATIIWDETDEKGTITGWISSRDLENNEIKAFFEWALLYSIEKIGKSRKFKLEPTSKKPKPKISNCPSIIAADLQLGMAGFGEDEEKEAVMSMIDQDFMINLGNRLFMCLFGIQLGTTSDGVNPSLFCL